MKEEKLVRIGFKKTILIILFILAIIFGVLFIIYHFKTTPFSNTTTTTATTSSGLTSKTTIYSDTRKSIPEYSTEKYILYSASIIQNSHFSFANQFVNLDNIFVTSNDELESCLNKCFNSDFFKIIADGKGREISEFFDDDFFKNYNLAIEMYNVLSSNNSSIVGVISNGDDATINIKVNTSEKNLNSTNIPINASTIKLYYPTINFIALDKDINNVNFDVYKNTTYEYDYYIDYEKLFIAGAVISIAVIIMVLLIVLSHNHKINSISNNSYNKSLSKRIIIGIIILILILTILYFSYLFCKALAIPAQNELC